MKMRKYSPNVNGIAKRVGMGPATGAKVGSTFTTQASDDWLVGQELTTWSNLQVRIISKSTNTSFGSWKYTYTCKVLANHS